MADTHGKVEHPMIVGEGQQSAWALSADVEPTDVNCPCMAYLECVPEDHCPMLEGTHENSHH